MTTTDSAAGSLLLQLGRTRAATMDVSAVLSAVCASLPAIVGVAAAVILLGERMDVCYASDAQSGWIGEAQRRSGAGPLPNAVRSGRLLVTPDMTRIGPPELAAAADQCGLISSVVLLLEVDGERFGALQLLGDAARPADATHADRARPVAAMLAARLADLRELQRLREQLRTAAETSDLPATTALPAVPRPRAPEPEGPTSVPSPRPRTIARHALAGVPTRPLDKNQPGRHGS